MLDLAKFLVRDHNCFCLVIYRCQCYKITLRIDQRMLQVCNHILHILIAAIHTLLCTFQDDLLQAMRQVLCKHTRWNHLQVLNSDCYCCISVKRNFSRNHLIHGNTKRIDITLLIAISATNLFRRTVMNRSHYV